MLTYFMITIAVLALLFVMMGVKIVHQGYRYTIEHFGRFVRVAQPGFNFVPGATEPPAISNLNAPHGTQVAGMAAANIAFCFSAANRFARAGQDLGLFTQGTCPAGTLRIPMIGGAPGASIVPLKVFPAAGGGSPTWAPLRSESTPP